jgi:hypothetical protein
LTLEQIDFHLGALVEQVAALFQGKLEVRFGDARRSIPSPSSFLQQKEFFPNMPSPVCRVRGAKLAVVANPVIRMGSAVASKALPSCLEGCKERRI